MDDAIDDIGRLGVRCGLRCFKAATLVDRNIDQYRTRLHMLEHGTRHQFWRARAGDQHRADHCIGHADFGIDGIERRIACAHAAVEQFVQLAQARD